MRDRKEIIDGSNYSWETINTKLLLEVLLDVRDLLEDKNKR